MSLFVRNFQHFILFFSVFSFFLETISHSSGTTTKIHSSYYLVAYLSWRENDMSVGQHPFPLSVIPYTPTNDAGHWERTQETEPQYWQGWPFVGECRRTETTDNHSCIQSTQSNWLQARPFVGTKEHSPHRQCVAYTASGSCVSSCASLAHQSTFRICIMGPASIPELA